MNNLIKKPVAHMVSLMLAIGLFLGFFIGEMIKTRQIETIFSSVKQIRLPNEGYPLVSRLIGSELPQATAFGIYTDAQKDIKSITDKEIKNGSLTKFSFYFRDLNTGLWFGVNENEEYVPASLFKLPIAMTYYKESMNDHDLLNRSFTYTQEIDSLLDTQIGLEKSQLIIGNSYTVEDLINKMLIDSDNGAKNLLSKNINVKTLNELFNLVQVNGPQQNNYFISPKEYAFFIRILYNASYLGYERSEKLLEVLSKTTFTRGIREAVPSDITVVQKFGSLNLLDKKTGQRALGFHDCGIVYYTSSPFLLCFMTQGDDQQTLANIVSKVTTYLLKYIESNQDSQ